MLGEISVWLLKFVVPLIIFQQVDIQLRGNYSEA